MVLLISSSASLSRSHHFLHRCGRVSVYLVADNTDYAHTNGYGPLMKMNYISTFRWIFALDFLSRRPDDFCICLNDGDATKSIQCRTLRIEFIRSRDSLAL